MPSPSDTFFNMKRLHAAFAVASLALLASTVWMVAADHRRAWKRYQRTFRDQIEPWTTEAAARERESDEFQNRQSQLDQTLSAARIALPQRAILERFHAEIGRQAAGQGSGPPDFSRAESAYQALAAEPSPQRRERLLAELDRFVGAARLRREDAARRLRFRRADFDEARTSYEAALRAGMPPAVLDSWREKTERIKADVAALEAAAENAAAQHQALTNLVAEMTRGEQSARQALAEHRAAAERLQRTLDKQRPSFGKWFLSLPLVDAFGKPLAIDQVWLPELEINYNFCKVARFDRCTTCHQGIDKASPGSPSEPLYRPQATLVVQLATPAATPKIDVAGDESAKKAEAEAIRKAYGLVLAERGLIDPTAVTIELVLPRTPAAIAGLVAGDVVVAVNGNPIADRADFRQRLLREAAWGKPLALEIQRGLPQPYCGHPRLDLFLGSHSPHPLPEFGCTICHDGQGSATEFKFASHTPNDLEQRTRWRDEHGWFWNRDWDFPMRPKRFAQSNCLRCHHDVTDLEQGTGQADPPAPKLLAGYHLVRRLGCFGCHELKGVGSAGERSGPDMRLEPNYHEAALALLADPAVTQEERRLADRVVAQPEDIAARRQLVALLRAPQGRGGQAARGSQGAMTAVLAAESPIPGTMRKVGPSLRDAAGRFDAAAIAAWIADPAGVRPTTRMPQFFGLHEHLDPPGLAEAQRFEQVEIRTMAEYLLSASRAVAPTAPPANVTEAPSNERGKRLFRVQGCVACHRHSDFPEGPSDQGPDLSRVGAMFRGPSAAKWLASWIRNPARHSPRTVMPNLLLAPISLDAKQPRFSDSAADLAAYLMTSKGWEPKPLSRLVDTDLDELALLYLSKTFPRQTAATYLRDGIPESMASQVSPETAELLGPITREKKIRYAGRRTIRKRGCFGCHDVPGFEDGLGIGPALSDWGRKQESLLAFEQIDRFLAEKGDRPGFAASSPALDRLTGAKPGLSPFSDGDRSLSDSDRAFYAEAIASKRREGFIWQKLRSPRSFDYEKTANKGYNEHLLMGRFSLTDAEREAITTFVLGLVAEPPKDRYLFRPDGRGKAIVEGRKVLDRYGCVTCHTLEMERWTIEYDPARFPDPPRQAEYDFLKPAIEPARLAASQAADRRGLCRVELVGMPQVNAEGKPEETEDEDGNPQYAFTLWEPAAIAGKVWPVGGAGVLVSPRQIVAKRPPLGGDFARLLYPAALAEAKEAGSAAAATEAWGWVPPALAYEGRVVQPAWLYEYLLDPAVLRPAAVLRMPKFNLSPGESQRLVDYFAAVSGVEFPYTSDPRARSARRGPATPQESQRLQRAMRFLTDRTTYCAKCHLLGDFTPGGEIRTTLAPDLARVASRIRPEYLRRWLASPKSALPYTAMPVNFPPDQLMGQDLFPASSVEQLDAVMDLLLNYQGYKGR